MGQSIKKGIYLLIACMALLLAGNSESGEDSAAAVAATQKTTSRGGAFLRGSFVISHQVDWKSHTVTIRWDGLEKASKYIIVCVSNKKPAKVLKKSVSKKGKNVFKHKFEYGVEYHYMIVAYRNDKGKQKAIGRSYYQLSAFPAKISWLDEEIKTDQDTTLAFCLENENVVGNFPAGVASFNALTTGVQIFGGSDKKHLKLLDTVTLEKLSDFKPKKYRAAKKYIDKNQSHRYYYQLRSYVEIKGKRWYGEKTKIKLFREPGYRGEVEASIKTDYETPYIKEMEVVINNTGKAPIKVGQKYIKNYYKEGDLKKKYVFLLHDTEMPLCSSNNLKTDKTKDQSDAVKIDKIEYKSQADEDYQILSEDTVTAIEPGQKMSFRFSRENGQEFNNYFLYDRIRDELDTDSAAYMTLYLFQYMGKKSFIRIHCKESTSGEKLFVAAIKQNEWGEP